MDYGDEQDYLLLPSQPGVVKVESDEDDHNIDYSYSIIWHFFRKFNDTPHTTTEDVDNYLQSDEVFTSRHLLNVGEKGSSFASFIHYLLPRRVNAQENKRFLLITWVMRKYPKLYLEGAGAGKSILDVALLYDYLDIKIMTGFLRKFIELYPNEVVDILKKMEEKDIHNLGKVLHSIIPVIRNSAPSQFLRFFREHPEETLSVKTGTKRPAPSQQGTISSEEIGDAIILRWPGELPEKVATRQNKQSMTKTKHPGSFLNEEKQTALHLAVGYCECTKEQSKAQLRLVKRLFSWCPKALERVNSAGHHPYLQRITSLSTIPTTQRHEQKEDNIAFFLKDKIMHLPDRDNVLDLLYGRSPGRSVREIHLDLREVQMSASSSTRKKALLNFINGLKLESILQCVQISKYPFRDPGASSHSPTVDVVETKPDKGGTGRRDFKEIFDVLKEKGVLKIHRLIVDDDDACVHQDEIIEALSCFEIEEFQWRKMDLSSSVLREAAPKVQTLRLFSSGNYSVLRDWSSEDGLNQLNRLSSVYIKIYWKTESQARTKKYATQFIQRMMKNLPNIQTGEVRLEPFTIRNHEEWPKRSLLVDTYKWIQTMQMFATFVAKIRQLLPKSQGEGGRPRALEKVRVAVLDDGIDWSFAEQIKCYGNGMSFYTDRGSGFESHNVWYSSSTDHGTLMAALIDKICPDVTLYIARLNQTESEQGEFQPTPESAAKAIDWAIQQGVHIISMSWTIPGEHKCLDDAVKEAHNKGIVMFGSASDQGAKRSNKPYMANEPYIANKQYMAKLAKGGQGPVICIAGARDFGLADERARSEGEFFFPGHINGIPAPLPPLKSNFGAKTGSSVATALAAGLAALIMLLVDMSPKYSGRPPTTSRSALSYREQLQDPMNFRRIFKTMLQQSEINTPSGESRNEIIIPVDMVFHPEDLNKELLEVHTDSRWEKGIFLLDEVLEPILRPLTESDYGYMVYRADTNKYTIYC